MRLPDVKIQSKADCSTALLDLCKSAKHRCSGTFNKVSGRELPCIGGGLVVSSYYETENDITDGVSWEGLMASLGGYERGAELNEREDGSKEFKAKPAVAPAVSGGKKLRIAHIVNTEACPCEQVAEEKTEDEWWREKLGVDALPQPSIKQLAGLHAFRDQKKPVYIYGPTQNGKSYLAYLCAQSYKTDEKKGRVKTLFKNMELGEFFQKNARSIETSEAANMRGLIVIDDIQENLPSPFFQSCLFRIFDLVKDRRLLLVIVANCTPEEFVKRYAVDELRKPQFESRVNKMEMIEI